MMSTKSVVDVASLALPSEWHDHPHFGHVVQFYSSDDFLLNAISRFIGTALVAGDSAVVIATQAHRDGLFRELKARGIDSAAIAKHGRCVALDAAETLSKFMRGGHPDRQAFVEIVGGILTRARAAAIGGNSRIAVFGEMVALLWAEGNSAAAIALEGLWNDLAKTQSFFLRCAYPISNFQLAEHSESFRKICSQHSSVVPHESYTALPSEERRLREITHLQQRAQALENEIAARKHAEHALRLAHDELEKRVLERTLELREKNLQISKQAEALEATNRGLRQLSARLLRVQDEERRRIARDLHDSTGQTLAFLSMNLASLQAEAERQSPELAKAIVESADIVKQVSGELRTMSYLLHPPLLDEMGLACALDWYIVGFGERSGIQVNLQISGELGRLPGDLETAIFRVVQECLTNIHRHSGSPTATVRLRRDSDGIRLEIEDEGKGIPAEKLSQCVSSGTLGLGLRGMRARIRDFGGEMEIVSPEKGTCIKVTVPIAESA
jgi:signal transduction histidine kinase